jgi:hypothetical protein
MPDGSYPEGGAPAAPPLVVNGTSFPPFNAAFNAGTAVPGVYYAVPPFGSPPREGAPEYEEIAVKFPGVPGVAFKRLAPFGLRTIKVELVFFGPKSLVETNRATLQDSFSQLARYTISLPDGPTRNGCRMTPGSGLATSQMVIAGYLSVIAAFEFRQYSEEN